MKYVIFVSFAAALVLLRHGVVGNLPFPFSAVAPELIGVIVSGATLALPDALLVAVCTAAFSAFLGFPGNQLLFLSLPGAVAITALLKTNLFPRFTPLPSLFISLAASALHATIFAAFALWQAKSQAMTLSLTSLLEEEWWMFFWTALFVSGSAALHYTFVTRIREQFLLRR